MIEREDVVWESHLPVRLGVSRNAIRAARKDFVEGSDWCQRSGRVFWSTAGVKKLAAWLLGAAEAVQGVSGAEKTAPGGAGARDGALLEASRAEKASVLLTVHLIFPLNPWVVRCRLGDGGGYVRCRTTVPSAGLRRGQVFPAQHVDGDLYQMVGKPSWRGVW